MEGITHAGSFTHNPLRRRSLPLTSQSGAAHLEELVIGRTP